MKRLPKKTDQKEKAPAEEIQDAHWCVPKMKPVIWAVYVLKEENNHSFHLERKEVSGGGKRANDKKKIWGEKLAEKQHTVNLMF